MRIGVSTDGHHPASSPIKRPRQIEYLNYFRNLIEALKKFVDLSAPAAPSGLKLQKQAKRRKTVFAHQSVKNISF